MKDQIQRKIEQLERQNEHLKAEIELNGVQIKALKDKLKTIKE